MINLHNRRKAYAKSNLTCLIAKQCINIIRPTFHQIIQKTKYNGKDYPRSQVPQKRLNLSHQLIDRLKHSLDAV